MYDEQSVLIDISMNCQFLCFQEIFKYCGIQWNKILVKDVYVMPQSRLLNEIRDSVLLTCWKIKKRLDTEYKFVYPTSKSYTSISSPNRNSKCTNLHLTRDSRFSCQRVRDILSISFLYACYCKTQSCWDCFCINAKV